MTVTVVLLTTNDRPAATTRGGLAADLGRQLEIDVRLVAVGEPADLVWLDTVNPEEVAAARSAYPRAGLLVTLGRTSRADDVVRAYALGADLVQRDEGPALACAALAALARRARRPHASAC